MKDCIWCRKTDKEVLFNTLAHTIPKSLGGRNICPNVCDQCNHFFGIHFQGSPSVENTVKETFNITRARILSNSNQIGKNKPLARFSSLFFNVDFIKRKIDLKSAYKFQIGFQEKMGRQFKKGLYKMFLEELERQKTDGHNNRYDFIREFARYDKGDYPVFYFERLHGIIAMADSWATMPELLLPPELPFNYLVDEPSFFEFEFLGHVFGIATSRHWELAFDNYIKKTMIAKRQFFKRFIDVKYFNDIDLALSILDNKPT